MSARADIARRPDAATTTHDRSRHEDMPVFRDSVLVHLVRQYKPSVGGLEDFIASLTAHQRTRFKRVRIVTCDHVFHQEGTRLPAHETIDGIEVVRLPYFGSTRYPICPSFLSAISDADLIHVHAIDFFFDALAATRWIHRKPLVATTHGGFFHTQNFRRIKWVWFRTMTRLSATGYRALACCSQSDYDRFRTIAPSRVRLIENGVDIGKLSDAGSKIPVKRIVTIGRLSENKRVDRVLDVFAELVHRDPDWRLDIIGMPFDWSADDVRAMIAARELSARVDLHIGPCDDEMRTVIGGASIFVSASQFEGFGIALIEAMSAGLVPVVHENAAFAGFAARHSNIAITDFANPIAAARAIENAYADLAGGDAGAKRAAAMAVADTYSWPMTAARYEALYRDIAGL